MNYNLFVYGTLKRSYGNNHLLNGQEFLGEAQTIENYIMECRGIPYVYGVDHAIKGNKRIEGKPIHGEVWKVSALALARIDRLEGHPRWYRRLQTPVHLNSKKRLMFHAWLYFMPVPVDLGVPTFGDHAVISDRYER